MLTSKFGTYVEKERFRPLHSTPVIFLVDFVPSSLAKKTSK
jgi:hypothetical protein